MEKQGVPELAPLDSALLPGEAELKPGECPLPKPPSSDAFRDPWSPQGLEARAAWETGCLAETGFLAMGTWQFL